MSKFELPFSYFMQREKKKQNALEYYHEVITHPKVEEKCKMRSICENGWYALRRPYYRIFPSVLDLFRGVKLDLECNQIAPPLKSLLIQLPDSKIKYEDCVLHNILVNQLSSKEKVGTFLHFYFTQGGEQCTVALIAPSFKYIKLEILLGEADELKKMGLPMMPDKMLSDAIRFYATVCLLAEDKELITPDVLENDKAEWEASKNWELQKKAIKRGKFGFNIGKDLEMSPHFRNGCMALYWTGHGRTEPRILWRSHSIVHRDIITKVPMGYLDDKKKPLTCLS